MAKKYYWLKLNVDFFNQREIKRLRKLAGGDTYTIIYLKMLLLAIQNEGKIYFEDVEDDFASEIALILDEEVDNVEVTLSYLESKRLIEYASEDELKVLEANNMTGSETSSAARVRKHRVKAKALQCNDQELHCTEAKRLGNTEKELELEKELEREGEQERDPRPMHPVNTIDSTRNIYSESPTSLVSNNTIDDEINDLLNEMFEQ
ncbi:phage replisome organizer N-terminal domain-containing protein [Abiotrophia defectiva]